MLMAHFVTLIEFDKKIEVSPTKSKTPEYLYVKC